MRNKILLFYIKTGWCCLLAFLCLLLCNGGEPVGPTLCGPYLTHRVGLGGLTVTCSQIVRCAALCVVAFDCRASLNFSPSAPTMEECFDKCMGGHTLFLLP